MLKMRLALGFAVFALLGSAYAQLGTLKISRVQIKHVGPASVSDELIRANIRVKPGDAFNGPIPLHASLDDDVRNLYATGFFYNIHVADEPTPEGLVITYVVQ